ncbi:multidrug ABC transporter substrate-binding protein [Polynucleobacter sp. SHI8]|jgi:putative ABC transport system permease protein|uniref:ABC transporter permease n=1 Tax=unclassified Polynucleobacter TaxID=2640945 RepID=UPI002491893B|nr:MULTISPECIES: ABC transporter permease [unclassified Polynucleobacter]BDW10229.1 multidrug ABC transporter substrate-binding protein [Polynucleobacter sp. SHI2]BDW12675.1 multidrug ABC transporter substrate-binding protein [Polynucleobacter sp. SHI8]
MKIASLMNLSIAMQALRVNKMRSILTMLGIVIGVAAVIAMIAIGGGAQQRLQEQIASLGSNLLIVVPGSIIQSGARLGAGNAQTLTEQDARAITTEISDVAFAAPLTRSNAQVVFGNTNWATNINGVYNDYFDVREWNLAEGRFFDQGEITRFGKVAILGKTVSNQLFGEDNPVGQVVRIRGIPFEIIGLMESKGQSSQGQDQDDVIFVPLTTGRNRLFGEPRGRIARVGTIMIKAQEGSDTQEVEARITELLRQRHRIQTGMENDFQVRNLTEILKTQEAASKVMSMLLAAVASVSLLVGGIGIMNIMLVSVTERTREIGLRLAVGARGRDIMMQFLVEAMTLATLGGAIGVLLGVLISWLVAYIAGWSISLNLLSIIFAVGFSAAIGVFFGYYPAKKAAKMQPIEALRYE